MWWLVFTHLVSSLNAGGLYTGVFLFLMVPRNGQGSGIRQGSRTFCRASYPRLVFTPPNRFNVAPTNYTKGNPEEAILNSLEKREQENTPCDDLIREFGIPKTTLYNHFQGMVSCQKAHKNHQGWAIVWRMHFCNRLMNGMLKCSVLDWMHSRQ